MEQYFIGQMADDYSLMIKKVNSMFDELKEV